VERTEIAWQGGVAGHLALRGAISLTIDGPSKLIEHARAQCERYTLDELSLLGASAFFLALRDARHSRAGFTLNSTLKILDSFYPVLPEPDRDRAFQRGIASVEEHLFYLRGEPPHILIDEAFDFVSRRLSEGAV